MINLSYTTVLVTFLFGAAQITLSSADGEETLQLLHVVFRHGDRTTEVNTTYPTDPYANVTYWPYGWGQLTNAGKRREFNLGAELRKRYDSFLGNLWYQGILDARSTDYNRTKASLELVLASLYPPTDVLNRWNWFLNWQPIPFNYNPINADPLLFGFNCPNLAVYLGEYYGTQEYLLRASKWTDLIEYISEHAGQNYTFATVAGIHFILETQDEWGFKLPEWSLPIYPTETYPLASQQYITYTATTNLKKVTAGALLQKITSDSQSKIEGTLGDTRIFLYSGHEVNVGTVLSTLGVFDPQVPQYGSCVTLEVHKIEENYFVRVLYQNYTRPEPYVLQLPSCDIYCPFDQFVSLVEPYYPDEDTCGY